MSELINKVKTKYEIRGEVQVAKVYPELENLTVTPAKTIQSFNHPDSYGYNNVVVKAIDCETLNVTPKKEEQAFDGMYDKVNVKAIDCRTLNITPKVESQAFDGMFDVVNVDAIEADTIEITPKQATQTFNGLYKTVNVGAIEADTLNVTPSKEQQTFNGLYETVNVDAMEVETLNITPTEETQTFNGLYETVNVDPINATEARADVNFSEQDTVEVTSREGEYLKKVTINKDADLTPENIKSGVNVFGIDGTMEIGTDTSDATATAEDIAQGKTAYVNGVKIEGTMAPSFDTSIITSGSYMLRDSTFTEFDGIYLPNALHASYMFQNCKQLETVGDINLPSCWNFMYIFDGCTSLKKVGNIIGTQERECDLNNLFYPVRKTIEEVGDITLKATGGSIFGDCVKLKKVGNLWSGITTMYYMFYGCTAIEDISMIDTSNVTNMNKTFHNCSSLTDTSLNKILQMCINATNYTGTKTLAYIGLSSSQATRCQSLSNYQAFLDAGWTTGF